MKQREHRAQEFMNKMADGVLAKMSQKQRHEEEMLVKYENEKENRLRQLEERRAQRVRDEQQKMRDFLANQMAEKKAREDNEKENINQ